MRGDSYRDVPPDSFVVSPRFFRCALDSYPDATACHQNTSQNHDKCTPCLRGDIDELSRDLINWNIQNVIFKVGKVRFDPFSHILILFSSNEVLAKCIASCNLFFYLSPRQRPGIYYNAPPPPSIRLSVKHNIAVCSRNLAGMSNVDTNVSL